MSKPRRVLHVSFRYDPHINNLAYRLLEAFADPRYTSVPLYVLAPRHGEQEAPRGGICLHADKADLQGRGRRGVVHKMRDKLRASVATSPWDCVMAHRMRGAILASQALEDRFRVGIVVVHGRGTLRKRRRRARVRSLLDARWSFAAISEAVREDLVTHGINKDRVVVIPNAMDVEAIRATQLERDAARDHLAIDAGNRMVLGTVSRLVPGKGIHALLEALQGEAFQDTLTVILGDGPERTKLETQSTRLGLGPRVLWKGHTPEAFMYMRAFDVLVHPSLEEGFGMVLLEAMAAERPIVATDAGGIPEVLGEAGELVPAGDSGALRTRLMDALSWTAQSRRARGRALLHRLRNRFALDDAHAAMREHVESRLDASG